MSGRSPIHREVRFNSVVEVGAAIQQCGRKKGRIQSNILLPMDLVNEEILTRLPAKSLMRFKCVSKLWSYDINSRYFTNRFLTRQLPRIYMCLLDSTDPNKDVTLSLARDTTTPSSFVVDHNLAILRRGCYHLQSLRGFMCYTYCNQARIFNPATRQLLTLPAPLKSFMITPPPEDDVKIISYYYGYDLVNDQYKVVCSTGEHLKHLEEMRSEHWIYVFKPGQGSWKKVAPNPPHYRPHLPVSGGVCIDAVIYYLGWVSCYNCAVVSFHISSEEFKTIQLPPRDGDELPGRYYNVSMVEYGGKVTIIDQTNLGDKGLLDLWVVKDAWTKEWSKKTIVLQPTQRHLVNGTVFTIKGTTQNGKLFFIPMDCFSPFYILCYDLQSNDLTKIEIKGVPEYWSNKNKSDVKFMLIEETESLHKVVGVDGSE